MRRYGALMILAGLVLALGLPVGPGAAPAVADGHGGDEGGEELHDVMEAMLNALHPVHRGARDASQNEATAANLARLGALTLAAKEIPPPMIGQAPEDQRAELTRAYRLMMIELAQAILSAEAAILEGRNDDAWEHLLEADDVMMRGHDMFMPGGDAE